MNVGGNNGLPTEFHICNNWTVEGDDESRRSGYGDGKEYRAVRGDGHDGDGRHFLRKPHLDPTVAFSDSHASRLVATDGEQPAHIDVTQECRIPLHHERALDRQVANILRGD